MNPLNNTLNTNSHSNKRFDNFINNILWFITYYIIRNLKLIFFFHICVCVYSYVCVYNVCIFFEFIFYDCTWYWLKMHLFYYLVYFCYYSAYFCYYLWILSHFLVLFMVSITLFGTIYRSHYTISASLTLSTILSVKSFQF